MSIWLQSTLVNFSTVKSARPSCVITILTHVTNSFYLLIRASINKVPSLPFYIVELLTLESPQRQWTLLTRPRRSPIRWRCQGQLGRWLTMTSCPSWKPQSTSSKERGSSNAEIGETESLSSEVDNFFMGHRRPLFCLFPFFSTHLTE